MELHPNIGFNPCRIGHKNAAHTRSTLGANGFSLVETLVMVSVVGILAALAVPHVSAQADRLTLRNEASALRLFLERSAAFALSSRLTVEVRLSGDTLSASQQGQGDISTHKIKNGIKLDPLSNSAASLLFHPTISASPLTLVLRKKQLSCSVIISLRGRIRAVC